MINLTDVSMVRDSKQILDAINWQVQAGQHWVLMGLNGSGKSSLLNIISGQQWPTTGTVEVLGERFGSTKIPDLRKRIGWVGSVLNAKINQFDTTDRIILSGIFNSIGIYKDYGQEELDQVDEVMKRLNITHLKGRKYLTCSQGQQQLVLIARSLISNPELLILDEPCNGLDIFATEQILDQVADLISQDNAPTVLYVTHQASEITPMFDHTLLLKDGSIFDQGETNQVLTTENLSLFYDHSVKVDKHGNRYLVYLDHSKG